MIGTKFGRYDIIGELGHGGMSVVYRGVDPGLERDVAIKVLHDHLAKKPENRQRLHREAKAIARLKHPNILEVFDFAAEDADKAYIVMEFVEGETLREFVDRTGVMPPEYGALVGVHLCRALAQAHEAGIIHRDLKPENIMVSRLGVIKLMDFGIAHVFDAETMTQTGSLLGSPAHMAPEMIEGERVDERADIFALGTVLYWLVTGRLPFEGKSAPQILKRVLEGIFKNPEAIEPKIGQCFGDIIRQCLAYEVEDRFQTIDEVLEALLKFTKKIAIEDPSLALQSYLKAPEMEREAFERALVPQLLLCARGSLDEQCHTEAFRVYNRVLAYDPQNAQVARALKRLQRRRQGPRFAVAIAAVLLTSTASYGAYKHLAIASSEARAELEDATARGSVVTPAESEAMVRSKALAVELSERRAALAASDTQSSARQVAARLGAAQRLGRRLALDRRLYAVGLISGINTPSATRVVALSSATRRNPTRSLEATDGQAADVDMGGLPDGDMDAKVAEVTNHLYRFRLRPPSATLTIAGVEYEAAQANQGIELQEGESYPMRVQCAQGCEPHTTTLRVDGPQDDARPRQITLAWRHGIVKISAPRDSLLYLPGRKQNAVHLRKGQVYRYIVKFGDAARSRNPQRELTFTIRDRDDMQRAYERSVTVRPGSLQAVTAKF